MSECESAEYVCKPSCLSITCHTCRIAIKPLCHRTYALMRAVGWEEDTANEEEADGAEPVHTEKMGDVEMTDASNEIHNPLSIGKAEEGGQEIPQIDDPPVRDRTHTIDRNVSRRSSASGRLSGSSGSNLKDKASSAVKSKRHSTSDLSGMI